MSACGVTADMSGRIARSADDPKRTCTRDLPLPRSLRHARQHLRMATYVVRLRTIFHEHSKLLKVPSNSSWMNLPLMGCHPIVPPNVPSSPIVPRISLASRSNVAPPVTTFPRMDSVTGAGLHAPVVAVAEPFHWPSYGPAASPICGDIIEIMTEATKNRRFIAALVAARPMCEVGAVRSMRLVPATEAAPYRRGYPADPPGQKAGKLKLSTPSDPWAVLSCLPSRGHPRPSRGRVVTTKTRANGADNVCCRGNSGPLRQVR
jgi:hypothetical protein